MRKLRKILAEEGLIKTAVFRVPEHVKEFAEVIEETAANLGHRARVKPFNSGVVGITIDMNGGKYIYIDQPGVVGLEDQSPGYIRFGKYPRGELILKHKARRFGDVQLTDQERRDAQNRVLMEIEFILDSE